MSDDCKSNQALDDLPILHLIAQSRWHEPAFVVGNRAGLIALRNAIDAALARAEPAAEVMCRDGEGYRVHVRCVPADEMDAIPLGYTDRELCPDFGDSWPHWMHTAA